MYVPAEDELELKLNAGISQPRTITAAEHSLDVSRK